MAFLFNDLTALRLRVLREYEACTGCWKGSHRNWWQVVRMPFVSRLGMLTEDCLLYTSPSPRDS